MEKNFELVHFRVRKWRKMLMIMKLVVFLIIGFSFSLSASVNSQKQMVSMSLKDASVLDVLIEIKTQTGLRFIYNEDKITDLEEITIEAENITVQELLEDVFKDSNLECKFEENVIMVVDKEEVPVSLPQQPQMITISGKVTDEYGDPLPFVNIYIKGETTKGVVTDQDGNYSLTVEEKEDMVLIASFIGFLTKEFAVNGRTVINLMLTAEIADLSEVVVTGYQTISSERASGSFKTLKVENLTENKTSDNVLGLLQGEVPGLLIQDDPITGSSQITLRGVNTFRSNSDPNAQAPLIVLDGFPLNGESASEFIGENSVMDVIEKINPNDIESLTVLKDAAAASIWGARAANGVIVITTKKGKVSDKPMISFRSSLSLKRKPDYTDANLASAATSLEVDEWAINDGIVWGYETEPLSLGKQIYYDYVNGDIDETERDRRANELLQNDYINEYSDLFLRNYSQQQYSLSINQGSDKYTYYASFNYVDEKNSLKGNGNQQYSTNLNFNAELLKGVRFSSQLMYSFQEVDDNGAGSLRDNPIYTRILDENGDYVDKPTRYNQARKDAILNGGDFPYDWEYNTKREYDNKDNSRKVRNTTFNAGLDIDLYKGLKAKLSYNYQYGRRDHESYYNEETWETRNRVNDSGIYELLGYDENWNAIVNFIEVGLPEGGILDRSYSLDYSHSYRGMLSYDGYLDSNAKHYITAIAGMDYRDVKTESSTLRRQYGYDPQIPSYVDVDFVNRDYISFDGRGRQLGRPMDVGSIGKDWNRYLSTYTNIGYTYDGKYTLTGSWRLDDSNLFGSSPKYRNIPLWSVGAKWKMAEESFIDMDFLNQLDFRVTYGTGGNIRKGVSPFLTINRNRNWRTNDPKASIRDFENQELRWEKTTTLNVGADFALFNSRLSGSVEYYSKYSEDVLGSTSVNSTWGLRAQSRNYAEISNKGFDASLNYNVIRQAGLNWNMSFFVNYNENTIEKLDFDTTVPYMVSGGKMEGNNISSFYTYNWAGLSDTGASQVYNELGEVVDYNTEITNEDALLYGGQLTPKYFGSYRNTVSYKGFTLDVLLSYKLGHKFRKAMFNSDDIEEFASPYLHKDYENRWQEEGDELTTDVPALYLGTSRYYSYYNYSNIMVEDASHIRVQNIGLSYSLNPKLLNIDVINNITFGVNASNLGVLWKATDLDVDPDQGNYAGHAKNTPIYSFNLDINF